MSAIDFDRRAMSRHCQRDPTRHPVLQDRRKTCCEHGNVPTRFAGLTKRVGNRFYGMAVGKTVKQQRNVSVAEDAALGVMKAADYLQQTLAEICGRHGITTDQYGMLRILRDAHPTGFA